MVKEEEIKSIAHDFAHKIVVMSLASDIVQSLNGSFDLELGREATIDVFDTINALEDGD